MRVARLSRQKFAFLSLCSYPASLNRNKQNLSEALEQSRARAARAINCDDNPTASLTRISGREQ